MFPFDDVIMPDLSQTYPWTVMWLANRALQDIMQIEQVLQVLYF